MEPISSELGSKLPTLQEVVLCPHFFLLTLHSPPLVASDVLKLHGWVTTACLELHAIQPSHYCRWAGGHLMVEETINDHVSSSTPVHDGTMTAGSPILTHLPILLKCAKGVVVSLGPLSLYILKRGYWVQTMSISAQLLVTTVWSQGSQVNDVVIQMWQKGNNDCLTRSLDTRASAADQGDTGHTSREVVLKEVQSNLQNRSLIYHTRIYSTTRRYWLQPIEPRNTVNQTPPSETTQLPWISVHLGSRMQGHQNRYGFNSTSPMNAQVVYYCMLHVPYHESTDPKISRLYPRQSSYTSKIWWFTVQNFKRKKSLSYKRKWRDVHVYFVLKKAKLSICIQWMLVDTWLHLCYQISLQQCLLFPPNNQKPTNCMPSGDCPMTSSSY